MRIESDIKLDFDDVLLKPKRSTIKSRVDVDLFRTFHFKYGGSWTGIPIISANMHSITTQEIAEIMASRHMIAGFPEDLYGINQSLNDNYMQTLKINRPSSISSKAKFVCIDVANGYMEKFVGFIKGFRNRQNQFSAQSVIVAGNVVSPEMVEALILAGADIVKVGIGSGMACTTRMVAGVGYPQLSAVIECADAAHGLGGHIISDGGCRTPADIVKAFAAGADFVMIGGMLAGHIETGSEFYGESSKKANEMHAGGLKDYRAPEGIVLSFVKAERSLSETLQEIEGGLRSACAYVGARRLKDLPKCATFVRVNRIK